MLVKVFSGLFVIGLIALSYGASQHNSTFAIVGAAVMVISGIGGFLLRKNGKS